MSFIVPILPPMMFLIGFCIAQLIWGPISDRYGRQLPLFIGIMKTLLLVAKRPGRHRYPRGGKPAVVATNLLLIFEP